MLLLKKIARCIASCGPLGYLPASGTITSFATMLMWLYIPYAQSSLFLCLVLFLALITVWISNPIEKDPSWIVVDEVVGMLISLYLLPVHTHLAIASFVVFRINDISKWGPLAYLEKVIDPWGIILDDFMAGIITAGLMHLYVQHVTL